MENERENIVQDGHSNSDHSVRSPSFPIHLIPLIIFAALAIAATQSFGVLRAHFLDATATSLSSALAVIDTNVRDETDVFQLLGLAHNPDLTTFTPEVQRWGPHIERWAETYDLPFELVAIVMQIESCGDPSAVSIAGARGLFQVMPFHFGADEDWMDAEINAARGMTYLARSYELSNGNIDLALAGYNGGHSVITRHPSTWSDETRRYVYWGAGIWSDIIRENVPSSILNEWLIAGGESLCRQAGDVLAPADPQSHASNKA